MKCRYRLTYPNGERTERLKMPQEGFWEGYSALLEQLGIPDRGPVKNEQEAAQIVRDALKKQKVIAAQDAGNGKPSGRRRK